MRRRRLGLSLAAALALSGCGRAAPRTQTAPAEGRAPGLPTEPPPPLPVQAVEFPPFHDRRLENGAGLIVVSSREQPVVSVSLSIRSGSAADLPDKPGVASMTASLLTKGTTRRSAEEISDAIDFVGGELSASTERDWTTIQVTVLSDFLETGIELLADVVLHPTFPEKELEIERRRALSSLEVELSQPATLATRRFLQEVYGRHPYGSIVTAGALESITSADVVAFHQTFYRSSNALFVVAGSVDPDTLMTKLDRYFGDWAPGVSPPLALSTPLEPTTRRLIFVHKPGAVQAVYRIGNLLPPARSEDWVALEVMNQILGAQPSSWLFRILRAQKGYTYGAYSFAHALEGGGYFEAQADVRNEVADSALSELFRALELIRSKPVPVADLAAAKSYLGGSFPLSIETPQQVARQLGTTLLLGRPANYLETFRTGVQATTRADVHRVARDHLRPDRTVIVVVGDARQILDKLRPFADTLEVYDERGRAFR